jgi:hypothetical protein
MKQVSVVFSFVFAALAVMAFVASHFCYGMTSTVLIVIGIFLGLAMLFMLAPVLVTIKDNANRCKDMEVFLDTLMDEEMKFTIEVFDMLYLEGSNCNWDGVKEILLRARTDNGINIDNLFNLIPE